MKRPWVMSLAAALTLPLLATAQPKTPTPILPSLGETIEVSIVNLDVIVTDRQGNRVRGLTAADFEILEDGKPQPITNFAAYGSAAAAPAGTVGVDAAAATPEAAAPQPRTIVLFIEHFKLPTFHRDVIFKSMRELLQNTVRPGDAVSIVTWDGKLTVRQGFTDDLPRLTKVLDDIAAASTGATWGDPYLEVRRQAAVRAEMLTRSGIRSGAAPESLGADVRLLARQAYLEQKTKTAALNSLIAGISGAEGKKVLLMATTRYSLVPGAEFLYATGSILLPWEFRNEYDATPLLTSLIRNANANGVTIYPIHTPGLANTGLGTAEDGTVRETTAADHAILANETGALDQVAKATGGAMAAGSVDIAKLLPRVQEDFESYYSLAYRASTRGEDRAHKVAVRTKNRDYAVRARREFVEKSEMTKMKDRVLANLFREPEPAALAITAKFGRVRKERNRFRLPVEVRIPIQELTTLPQDGKHVGAFSVFLVSGQNLGTVSDITQQTQPFTIDEEKIAKAGLSHFTYELELVTDSAVERVSIGVLDEVSKEFGLVRVSMPEVR